MPPGAPPTAERLIVGAMSGTSADGVDVALVRVTGRGESTRADLLAHRHRPYADELRGLVFSLRAGGPVTLPDVARCTRGISLAYAAVVNDALAASHIAPADLSAIAAHGQTLYHAPPDTIQLLDPALLAARVGCPVVSDFRRADCAAGGQGAPLVPFADHVLFRHPTRTRVLLNIGGIANLTYLRAGGSLDDLVAFDTGPGNCVSDWICRTRASSGTGWDVGGDGASRGSVIPEVRDRFLALPYFSAPPPKSTDGPAMIAAFDDALAGAGHAMNDLLSTAACCTAATIASGISGLGGPRDEPIDVIASGGGVQNRAMIGGLRSLLGKTATIRSTDDLGIPPDAKEAVAFALLAAATLDGLPSNVPAATGASRPVVLGSITPRP